MLDPPFYIFQIPNLSEEEFARREKTILPLIEHDDGDYWHIAKRDPNRISYTWQPEFTHPARELTIVGEITTLHTFGCYIFFKPSVGEVLRQIPQELVEKVNAFAIVEQPETAEDLNKEKLALNAGFHVAATMLYWEER